jgi:hypothetical protein
VPGAPPGPTARARGTAVALGALALLVLSVSIAPVTNNDIFLHLKTGHRILQTGQVPRVDDYSTLARGRPYVAHEWLSAVLFALGESLGGFDALIVTKALAALLLAGLLYRAARLLGATPVVTLPALALVMVLAGARIMERPHIFSYVLSAAVLCLLAWRRSSRSATPLLALPPLQVLWANLHGGFLLGPALAGLAAAGAAIDGILVRGWPAEEPPPRSGGARRAARRERASRAGGAGDRLAEAARLGGVAILMLLASLLNPYGARLLAFPFELTGSSFMRENYEWAPPFGSDFAGTYMMREYLVWALFGLAVLGAAIRRAARLRQAPPGGAFPFLVFGVLLALSTRMQRNVTDFALATLPAVASCASWLRAGEHGEDAPGGGDRDRPLLAWMAAAILATAVWIGWAGYPYRPGAHRETGFGLGRNIPVAAADYLQANGIRGSAFNTYSAGAYLVYRFYPAVRVEMDSRNDVYGPDLYHAHLEALADPAALRQMLERVDASFAFVEWASEPAMRALASFRGIGGWSVVYFDDSITILLRDDGPWAKIAARDRFGELEPSLYSRSLPRLEHPARALEEAERAIAADGGSAIARVMRVNALLALGRVADANAEESRILRARPPLHYIYTFLGILAAETGDEGKAAARFREALRYNPGDRTALAGLKQR